MAITEEGQPRVQLWGPLLCQYHVQKTVKRAELWAFLKTLEVVLPPCRIYTEHMGILDDLAPGVRWCLSWKCPHADLRRRIWHTLVDLGLGIDCAQHVQTHRSKKAIGQLNGLEGQVAQDNEAVDPLAKAPRRVAATASRGP
ncbi:unnamed protein product [Prorocentrum cordatum]|uniref:Uncharacterized protein n=1 Tax=Prorocentrum cordatum TaxID=2364126 RepID=A0ABN9PIU5_9DINO|nr:unnamed protein product [Polarella glacialis]